MVSRQSQTYQQAVDRYEQQYHRSPPPGFEDWFSFAKQHNAAVIDDYGQLEKDLAPLRSVPSYILRQRMESARTLNRHRLCQWDFVNGTALTDAPAEWEEVEVYKEIMNPFVHKVPDFAVLHNWNDPRRVCGFKDKVEDVNDGKVQLKILLVVSVLACFGGVVGLFTQTSAGLASRPSNSNKIAFATLLSIPPDTAKKEKDMNEDNYFVATRLLCYQLLHDPQTRNRLGAPCIVMTTPAVSQAKIDRLKQDGATIFPITEPLVVDQYDSVNQRRFQDVWSKLLVWKWTQFEHVLFVDNDMVLSKPLDNVFHEPQIVVRQTKQNSSAIVADEGTLPSEYLWAPIPEMEGGHDFPLKKGQYRDYYPNAGFFVLKPSLEMFEYMLSVLAVPGKFDPIYPEQNLKKYVFRREGNMPWSMLDPKWAVHRAVWNDVVKGAVSVHEKFWWRGGE